MYSKAPALGAAATELHLSHTSSSASSAPLMSVPCPLSSNHRMSLRQGSAEMRGERARGYRVEQQSRAAECSSRVELQVDGLASGCTHQMGEGGCGERAQVRGGG